MTDKEEKNPLIRMSKCDSCEQPVAIRADKHGKAYYNCTNVIPTDGTKCRRSVRFSITETRRLNEDVARQQAAKPEPADAGAEEPQDNPLKQASATPETPPQPAKNNKTGGGFSLADGYEQ